MGRVFGFLGTIIVLGAGLYIYSIQLQGTPSTNGADTAETANIVGVKNDLISIANAERGYFIQQQKYASLDELISANYITIQKQRIPYIYDVQTTSSGFRATATRDRVGAPIQLWIDETMQVQSSN
jgi:hypothetical protein